MNWNQKLEDSPSTPSRALVTCWKIMTPRCSLFPTEQCPSREKLLSMTERILEVRAITSGSNISLASFTDSCVALTEVAGRHGIEIADQASCAAGWNSLSSSGRHRFWHIHCTLTPKLIIYSFPVAVQQWPSTSNPSELSLQPRFRSARDQLQLYLSDMHWQHMHGRYFLLDISKIPGSWTLVTLQALLDEPRGLLKYVTGSGTLNVTRGGISSNASCIVSCLRPLTQRIPFSLTERMRMAARTPQLIRDALKRFSCAQCDAMTAPKIPRGVSVPQTVTPLRYVAMDVKWLPRWKEDVRIKSVNIVDEASNVQHIYPFFETETSEFLLRLYRQ